MASLQWLAQLDAVLCFKMAARQIVGSRKGNKQRLTARVKRRDRGPQNRGERPIGVECNRSVSSVRTRWLCDGYVGTGFIIVRTGIRDHDVRAVISATQEDQQKTR